MTGRAYGSFFERWAAERQLDKGPLPGELVSLVRYAGNSLTGEAEALFRPEEVAEEHTALLIRMAPRLHPEPQLTALCLLHAFGRDSVDPQIFEAVLDLARYSQRVMPIAIVTLGLMAPRLTTEQLERLGVALRPIREWLPPEAYAAHEGGTPPLEYRFTYLAAQWAAVQVRNPKRTATRASSCAGSSTGALIS